MSREARIRPLAWKYSALHPGEPLQALGFIPSAFSSMLLRLAVSSRGFPSLFMRAGGVVFVQLLGASGTFEFMTFAGNAKHRDGHNKDGE
jgi:hypothetical protein